MKRPRRAIAAGAALMLLGACSTYRGPPSWYQPHYEGLLGDFVLPSTAQIDAAHGGVDLPVPADALWEVCLQLACQQGGLLGLGADADGTRRLVFVHGLTWSFRAPLAAKNGGRLLMKYVDVWLAVRVRPEGPDKSNLCVAFVEPSSGRPIAARSMAEAAGAVLPDEPRDVGAAMLRTAESFRGEASDATLLAAEVPEALRASFVRAVRFAAERAPRLEGAFPRSVGAPAELRSDLLRPERVPGDEERLELLRQAGNWLSAVLRRTQPVLENERIRARIEEIVARLYAAARQERPPGAAVFVLASGSANAFVLPNGDIFVQAGLLEKAAGTDELAFALAHEIDHHLQRDLVARVQAQADAEAFTAEVFDSISILIQHAGAPKTNVDPTTGVATQQLSSLSDPLRAKLLSQVMTAYGPMAGSRVGAVVVAGYGREQEQRADEHALVYMQAAGYRPEAALRLLAAVEGDPAQLPDPGTDLALSHHPDAAARRKDVEGMLLRLAAPPRRG